MKWVLIAITLATFLFLYYRSRSTGKTSSSTKSGVLNEDSEQGAIKRGLYTVCAWCKRYRNHDGEWTSEHRNLTEIHPDALGTHGICPDCRKKFQQDAEGFSSFEESPGENG